MVTTEKGLVTTRGVRGWGVRAPDAVFVSSRAANRTIGTGNVDRMPRAVVRRKKSRGLTKVDR